MYHCLDIYHTVSCIYKLCNNFYWDRNDIISPSTIPIYTVPNSIAAEAVDIHTDTQGALHIHLNVSVFDSSQFDHNNTCYCKDIILHAGDGFMSNEKTRLFSCHCDVCCKGYCNN